jgi:hypothetical protein
VNGTSQRRNGIGSGSVPKSPLPLGLGLNRPLLFVFVSDDRTGGRIGVETPLGSERNHSMAQHAANRVTRSTQASPRSMSNCGVTIVPSATELGKVA